MTFIHEKNILAFLCHFNFWSTWIKQGPNFPKHCKQQREKIHETRIFKHWTSGSSGQYFLRKKHTHTDTQCFQRGTPRMNECTRAHTHTPVFPAGQTQNASVHTHTPVFPAGQTQNASVHAHTPVFPVGQTQKE